MSLRLSSCVSCLLPSLLLLPGCSRAKVDRVEWVVMGTVAAVQTRGGSPEDWKNDAGRTVRERFQAVNDEFNAHDPNSTVRRLGTCSPFGWPCQACAQTLCEQSGRAFNPRWRADGRLDFGAIAKGFAVDIAAAAVTNAAGDMLIDLGGNLKSVRGSWQVGIAESDLVLTLTNGMACATSAEYYRGRHIRDGRTGEPVTNGVYSVTVIHPSSAMLADGLSTTLFVLGKEKGEAFLRAHYPEATAYWILR